MHSSTTAVAMLGLFTFNQPSIIFANSIPTGWVDLPWTDLEDKLTSSTIFIETDLANYKKECLPVFEQPIINQTNHDLIDLPSGLCLPMFFCGFAGCNPVASEEMTWIDSYDTYDVPYNRVEPLSADAQSTLESWVDPSNPSYNLPSKVLFPLHAGDVAAVVTFANEHGVELSVKNSGHSYTGSSTKKNTLLLNMNQYKLYSSNNIDECDADVLAGVEISSDLSNQPCKLALARGKLGTVRVGGGENFDKLLRSVKAFNEKQEEYKFHAVSGAAGTVSPMGWTFLAGLTGTSAGRLFGFGLDSVLQVEMILPTGAHVRFGPTAWENEDGYMYPRSTEITGVCNNNPYEEDENNWIWSTCEEEVNFNDLWFAQLGGGGGTFGVVLSLHFQLNQYHPLEMIIDTCGLTQDWSPSLPVLQLTHNRFLIDFLLDPEVLGVSYEESYKCSRPSGTISGFFCFGTNSSNVVVEAWDNYMSSQKSRLMEGEGVSESDIDYFTSCPYGSLINYKDDAERAITFGNPFPEGSPNYGKAVDDPGPNYPSDQNAKVNILVPKQWIIENKEEAALLIAQSLERPYVAAFSTQNFSDQANSLSDAHRNAGFMLFFNQQSLDESFTDTLDVPFYSELFPKMYDVTDSGNFPAYLGANHASPTGFGPLKSDLSKACPSTWTQSERNEKCISMQEAIYGTTALKRLESIKENIDPNHIFDCYRCIGNNGAYSTETNTETTDAIPTDDGGGNDKEMSPKPDDGGEDGETNKQPDNVEAMSSASLSPVAMLTSTLGICFGIDFMASMLI